MATSPQRLLSTTFITDALTQEVHQLLSLGHIRQIMEALEAAPDGQAARWIDVHIIGDAGSNKTAFVLLNRLAEAGWATAKGPKGSRIWSITERGRRALTYARDGDLIGKAPVGAR